MHKCCESSGLNTHDSLTWQVQMVILASGGTYFSDPGWKIRAWWRFLCWRRLEWCGSASRKSYRSQTGDLKCRWGNQTNMRKKNRPQVASVAILALQSFAFFSSRNKSFCINFNSSTTRSALWQEKRTSCKLCLVAAEKQKRWMLEPVKMFSNFTVNYRMNELVQ